MTPVSQTVSENSTDDAGVKTGDVNNPALWGAVAIGAGAIAAVAVISKKKRAAK